MGHLCSCHRKQKFDKGGQHYPAWKSESSLVRKLRIRYSNRYSNGASNGWRPETAVPAVGGAPLTPEDCRNGKQLSGSQKEKKRAVSSSVNAHCSSSPSSPAVRRTSAPPPKPPRMRSMVATGGLVNQVIGDEYLYENEAESENLETAPRYLGVCRTSASLVDFTAVSGTVPQPDAAIGATTDAANSNISVSISGNEVMTQPQKTVSNSSSLSRDRRISTPLAPSTVTSLRHLDKVDTVLMSRACELIASSAPCVQPELLVDFLRRRDVIHEETASAVRRCATVRAAYELLVEVVISKGRPEILALCDALRAAGSGDQIADCLQAISELMTWMTTATQAKASAGSSTAAAASQISRSEDKTKHCDIFACVCKPEVDKNTSTIGVSRFDVDVVYLDPSTGTMIGSETVGTFANRSDATSAARLNCQRHRSVYFDPETVSLPSTLFTVPGSDVTSDRLANGRQLSRTPVVSVTINDVCLNDQLICRLADALLKFPCVRVLQLIRCHRIGPGLSRLRRLLVSGVAPSDQVRPSAGCCLTRLDIRLCRDDLGSIADHCLVSDLISCVFRNLRALNVSGNVLTSAGGASVFRHLVSAAAGSRTLFELDIGYNDVSDVRPVANALAGNCCLRRLRMRGNAIGPEGAIALFDALRRNYRLELLDLSGNSFGSCSGGGVSGHHRKPFCKRSPVIESDSTLECPVSRAIGEALVCNRTLRELILERCGLGFDDCQGLARGLQTNATLTSLDLSGNPSVGDSGLSVIADALGRNHRCGVDTISLNMCSISDEGLRRLLESIVSTGSASCATAIGTSSNNRSNGRSKLRRIKLCYNCIGTTSPWSPTSPSVTSTLPAFGKRAADCLDGQLPSKSSFAISPSNFGSCGPISGRHTLSGHRDLYRSDSAVLDGGCKGNSSQETTLRDHVTSSGSLDYSKYRPETAQLLTEHRSSAVKATKAKDLTKNSRQPSQATDSINDHNRFTPDSEISQAAQLRRQNALNNTEQQSDDDEIASTGRSKIASKEPQTESKATRPSSLCTVGVMSKNASSPFTRGFQTYQSHRHYVSGSRRERELHPSIVRSASAVIGGFEVPLSPEANQSRLPGFDPVISALNKAGAISRPSSGAVDSNDMRPAKDVYQLLCKVLSSNPDLKILLWGNGTLTGCVGRNIVRGRFADVREEEFVPEDVTDSQDMPRTGRNIADDLNLSVRENDSVPLEHSSPRLIDSSCGSVAEPNSVWNSSALKYATLPRNRETVREFIASIFR